MGHQTGFSTEESDTMTPQSDRPTPRPRRRRIAVGAASLALTVAVAGALITSMGDSDQPGRAGTPPRPAHATAHAAPAAIRTLAVSTGSEPRPSAAGAAMHGVRISGAIPIKEVVATVLSDEDCTPDDAGVSHCRNTVRLPNGKTLTVKHPHRMADVPCMTPGERVRVTRAV